MTKAFLFRDLYKHVKLELREQGGLHEYFHEYFRKTTLSCSPGFLQDPRQDLLVHLNCRSIQVCFIQIFYFVALGSFNHSGQNTSNIFLKKVKQVAWMFVYQLVGGMGTTLWCKNFFFSMLVVEVKWLNGCLPMLVHCLR